MKVKDLTNSQCDVRNYMSIGISEEAQDELAQTFGINYDDIERVLRCAYIYVKGEHLETEVEPFDVYHFIDKQPT